MKVSIVKKIKKALKNPGKRKAGIITFFVVAALTIVVVSMGIYGASEKYGTVSNSMLSVRADAGTGYERVGYLLKGAYITILSEKNDSSGNKWYEIKCGEIEGYCSASYIKECSKITTGDDAEFESYLTSQGFPDSYKESLRLVHKMYPNWIFKAYDTGLEWSDAVEAEAEDGVSLISGSSISSWKSTSDTAYDWDTSTWITGWDSGDWVLASDSIISFYMDPRNFLTSEGMFIYLDQKYDPSQTLAGVESIADGTFLEGDATELDNTSFYYPQAVYDAGKTKGVNPYVLTSMILQEMGSAGASGSISGTYTGYEGYYNYYNIGSYATSQFPSAIQRGLWFAAGGNNGATTYNRPWNTRYTAIMGGAEYYYSNYIAQGQSTLYYKRFNVQGSNLYTHQYMTNIAGAYSEAVTLAGGYTETARSEVLTFIIPIYKNMPSSPCLAPVVDGSPNNKLSNISVTNYEMTPDFDKDINEYSIIVPNDITAVYMAASAIDSTADISMSSSIPLSVGVNTADIKVTAENGDVRIYSVTIAREAGSGDVSVVTDYTLSDSGYLTGVGLSTTSDIFLGNFTVTNAAASVSDSAGSVKTGNTFVGTSDILTIKKTDGTVYSSYKILIYGDLNADGKITTSDMIKLRNYIIGTGTIADDYIKAADTSKDGSVKTGDMIKIRNHILGTSLISQ